MKHERKRTIIQFLAAAFFNGYAAGFAKGQIFKGGTKILCVPVLNCYSCGSLYIERTRSITSLS